ncbi:MAG: dUTP diphosphatase [Proteobacteria bacterium]|nr:dUTP diphosphatase [Pseudomonadota bacterium]MBU1570152.1 dUTP diphosphatase [Pseudomonadota bacterium]
MGNNPTIRFLRLKPERDEDIPLPRYMTPLSAGMDICASIEKNLDVEHGNIELIPTGLAVAIPPGFEIEIRPRSGLAAKHGISIINSPGTIDADYRGEIMIAVINLGKKTYTFRRGDRIAQMLVKKVYQANVELVEELDDTRRSKGGFGHTGL